jgi:sugar/nucleoside kinase (ribokinase family)
LFDEAGVFAAPGFPLEDVVDPTGAGDSFAGGFIGYLASQTELGPMVLRRAMIHATATASFCVEAVGTGRMSRLLRDDVEGRVLAIRSLYDYGQSL